MITLLSYIAISDDLLTCFAFLVLFLTLMFTLFTMRKNTNVGNVVTLLISLVTFVFIGSFSSCAENRMKEKSKVSERKIFPYISEYEILPLKTIVKDNLQYQSAITNNVYVNSKDTEVNITELTGQVYPEDKYVVIRYKLDNKSNGVIFFEDVNNYKVIEKEKVEEFLANNLPKKQ